ncbi:MAG: efflux RND transporter permease subunit [Acidobacteriota bacterium]|nr:efflux RND transporter permease subunit [Acidobacteriota bacterium]
MRQVQSIQDVNSDLQVNSPQINVDIERKQASVVGVTVQQIQTALGDAFGVKQISTIYKSTNEYQVILEVKPDISVTLRRWAGSIFMRRPERQKKIRSFPPPISRQVRVLAT